MKFKVVLEKQPEGGYTVTVSVLPGYISEGETRAEALRNIQEVIELYLEPDEVTAASKSREVVEDFENLR